MKNLQKITLLTLCIFCIAIFTSACGSSKNTPPDNSAYYYYLLANQNNNQQENNNNTEENNQQENNNNPEDNNQQENNQQENNQEENNQEENNQEENNQEENQEETQTEITLTLTDSLNEDQIATADIYYKVEKTTQSSNNEDQEILKATPNPDDNTKFTITVNGTATNTKIKAILTYDSTGECLDYFSSYTGVEAQNDAFTINFENNTENDFEEGSGTEEKPYIISNPRHFANINKQDNNGDYLYLGSHFQQSKDIDFTHLTGLKIVTDEDKNITIETINEKAPFYNEGHGIVPISSLENAFTGTYDGDNHVIDGIHIVNPQTNYIGLFTHLNNATLQKITIGENSIIFIDENDEVYSNGFQIGTLSASIIDSTIENSTNNAQIIIKNINIQNELKTCYIGGITAEIKNSSNSINNINNGKITIEDNIINNTIIASGIISTLVGDTNNKPSAENCTNNGNINVNNNNVQIIFVSGILVDFEDEKIDHLTNLKNTGTITINNNTTEAQGFIQVIDSVDDSENITNFTNEGNITTEGNSENFIIL